MAPETFPLDDLLPTRIRPFLPGSTIASGRSLSGMSPVAAFDAGPFWMLEVSVSLHTAAAQRLWMRWEGKLAGGAMPVIVPCTSRRFRPADAEPSFTTWDDGSNWDDGSQWYSASILTASVFQDASLGDVSLDISVPAGSFDDVTAFGIDHATEGPRTYRVLSIEDLGGNILRIGIWPPLRDDTPGQTPLDFENPRCVMTLDPASVAEFGLADDGSEAYPKRRIVFREHFDAPVF